jgi:rhamnogalacturonan endolyase
MKTPFRLSLSHWHRCLGAGTLTLASAGLVAALCATHNTQAQNPSTPSVRQMETLGRGVVAVDQGNGKVFVSWRLLATDAPNVGFNLYRKSASGTATKLNPTPLTASTNFVDESPDTSPGTTYYVTPVLNGVPAPGTPATPEAVPVWAQQYMRLPLQRPDGGTVGTGTLISTYTYSPGDCSVGDVDGDGTQELIVKWDPSNQRDNANDGFSGNVLLDAYKLNGTRLWRIDLGRNIRAGAHYTQVMVYDFDGDGKAEVACKTADGTISGTGQVLGNATADYRNPYGRILSGPEYLTVFNGLTGAAYPSVRYLPQRDPDPAIGDNPTGPRMTAIWGDSYGNRIDRFLACVAYLDGVHPSLVMSRGYYDRTVLVAWDFKNGQLTQRWTFDSDDPTMPGNRIYRSQGYHNLSVADVDADGKDEIVFGACAIDDNGQGLYSTRRGHGDAMHVSDFDPTRPGLEVFSVHESPSQYGAAPNDFRDARTGTLIWGAPGPNQGDVGRGIAMDIDPRTLGAESWSSRGGLYAANGTQISTAKPSSMNFAVWWDGDLLRETLGGTAISKWNWQTNTSATLLEVSALGGGSNNGTKATPNLSADLFGDWREEVIWRNTNNEELLIFTTTIPTKYRLTTLMHDSHYRLSIAWQNVGYNQPPHTGFYLGDGMKLDNVAPTILASGLTVGLVNGTRTIEAADLDYGSYDAGSGIASISISPSTFTCANLGSNNVTLTVTDSTGNASTQTVQVVVVDNTAPVILAAGLQVRLLNGTRTIDAADIDYGSTDDCGIASMRISPSTFTCANVGPNEVTLTVTDKAGNVATQKVTVEVQADNSCPSSLAGQSAVGADFRGGELLHVYPNPAVEQATVAFRPAQAGPAQVKVYNQLGMLVAMLFNGNVEAQRIYSLSLDGRALPNGIYNCQLVTKGKTVSKRLVISK